MSCVDSSVVSSSAFLVLASSFTRLLFLSSRSRRYFSSSFLGSLAARAVVLGIEISLLLPSVPSDTGTSRMERGIIPEIFQFGSTLSTPPAPLPQGLTGHPEPAGREGAVAACPAQCLSNVSVGQLPQGPRFFHGRREQRLRGAERAGGKVFRPDLRMRAGEHGALDD